MITKTVGDKPRRACPSCGFIHFTDPKVGVGVLVIENGRILLVKRAVPPEKGKWSIPAGFVDRGEDPAATAVREAYEETNLHVAIEGVFDVYHNPPAKMGASIFILYSAQRLDGNLQAGDDAADAQFFDINNLPQLAFASTKDAIQRFIIHHS